MSLLVWNKHFLGTNFRSRRSWCRVYGALDTESRGDNDICRKWQEIEGSYSPIGTRTFLPRGPEKRRGRSKREIKNVRLRNNFQTPGFTSKKSTEKGRLGSIIKSDLSRVSIKKYGFKFSQRTEGIWIRENTSCRTYRMVKRGRGLGTFLWPYL